METLRWLATILLVALFLGLTAFNWRAFWRNTVKQGRAPNAVPVVAGLIGAAAAYVCPLEGSSALWWIPLVVDFGTLPYGVWLGYATAFERP